MRAALTPLRRAATLATAALVAVSTALLPATPAAAHGQLATSTPLADTVVTKALDQLTLVFTEQPHPQAHFTLTAPSGLRVEGARSSGEPIRLDKPVQEYYLVEGKLEPKLYHTGFPTLLAVSHWPVTGRYTASYLSIASDGDEVRGSLTFDYQGPTGAAPAGWVAPTSQAAPDLLALLEKGHSDPSRSNPDPAQTQAAYPPAPAGNETPEGGLSPWLVPGIVVAVVAAIVVVAARRRTGATPARPAPAARRTAAPGGGPKRSGAAGRGRPHPKTRQRPRR
ncbi:copper resistance protein CopC [Micromonospora sp. WMMA1923]|uniref:copper resistance protein CopC n=1 Tax=Micromonospora sp. WMMA1923 TaxID=3404125 RepID=UPI003B94AC10